MVDSAASVRIRPARRLDVPALVDLRVHYLAEIGRLEPRFQLLPDVRERTEHALPVWMGQDDRTLLVAETDEAAPRLVGYATGVVSVWPPVWRCQHVGEVAEVYVLPEIRGQGTGRALLASLGEALTKRGAEVLRASVPVRGETSLARFRTQGYEAFQHVLEKSLVEG
jgi:GNAT superfamily N-acetyltransferase